eukprot:MONOS_15954.1-p1 / transcript=MONOS_15954.1 / gene=MONOS_15954 / organism=Monocercomonoides_exilis_PA203 / gene_product=unspecified product / transcript_product=unspecified product / location=Mono_scaffold01426:452-1504(-) / protein_length=332 / sequence_SO=supercontig / SO=protein_coding / is_pseudo=false
MIIDENEKKGEKNEKLLVDICECNALLNNELSSELVSIIVPCLLNVALKKAEDEETQKEVEMALLALSNIPVFYEVKRELLTNKIKEIIKYHQEHRTLTKLAYQSAWEFLIYRLDTDKSYEAIVNELHFAREAARELDELMNTVNWRRAKKAEKEEKETKEELVLLRWLSSIFGFFQTNISTNEEFDGLISSLIQIFRSAKDNHREASNWCIYLFKEATENRAMKVDALLESGAVDNVLVEIQQPTLNERVTFDYLEFFFYILIRSKIKEFDEMEEAKRKIAKKKILEKMEEEGYEDIIASFHETLEFFQRNYDRLFSLNVEDYLVNVFDD